MIKFFRKIRQSLISENKFSKYLLYAIGEIVLVVIGILIALQINNANIQRINNQKEFKYLENIKIDLQKDIENIHDNLDFRLKKSEGTQKLIQQIKGLPIDNLTELTYNVMNTVNVERFQPSNVTYNDMVSSGNLNLISNDSIKITLFELSLLYQKNMFYIDHETSEYEEHVSKLVYKLTDFEKMTPVFLGIKTAREVKITEEDFYELFQSKEYKNGIVISNLTSKGFTELYQNIETKSKKIIELINIELEK